ncbi:MAG: FlgD immunoglobulin-like domain containing protein [Treponemataceae bacterium]
MKNIAKSVFILFSIGIVASTLFAYDPPRGGETANYYASPFLIDAGSAITSTESPGSDALNPAASAGQQRTVLEAGYTAIVGTGAQTGWGSGINLGITIPRPYGVWTASTNFLTIPASLTSYPLGTLFALRGSFAKDLSPDLFIGAGANVVLGQDWGLAADLGILGFYGDVGFLKDVRLGAVVSGLGKGYAPAGTGAAGNAATAFPSPFTLTIGARGDLLKVGIFRFGNSIDLSYPSFQNVIANLGFQAAFGEILIIRGAWNLNLHELLNGPPALLPSVGVTLKLVIDRKPDDSYFSKQGWDKSEVRPTIAVRPLYDNIFAVSTGVNVRLGVIDRTPPIVALSYPVSQWGTFYLSPNADGKQDDLFLPLSILESRYLIGYTLMVYRGDQLSEPIRTITNKESRPETEGVRGFWDRLTYVKKGIPVPKELVWNGFTDSGVPAADGPYTLVVEAVDDNGNRGKSAIEKVIIDSTTPSVEIAIPADSSELIFSPDGDGSKDTLTIRETGSIEDSWKARLSDTAGNVVRTIEFKNTSPADFVWDGKNDAEAVIPDGVYSYEVETIDRAANHTKAWMGSIVLNTQQPPLSITIDSGAFSPNGDKSKDTIALLADAPVRTGLASWHLAVIDEGKIERWAASGTDSAGLKDKIIFDGRDSAGKIMREGAYQAILELKYVNGYTPKATSPVFVLDLTPPKAGASIDRTVFNPVGDDGKNRAVFSLTGSDEPNWTAEAIGADGKKVQTWNFQNTPEARLEWDGRNENGRVVADGLYEFRLFAIDRAGNFGSVEIPSIRVDTEKKAAVVSVDARAFSPNGDGVKDTVRILPEVRSIDAPSSWEIKAKTLADKSIVRNWTGSGAVPSEITWDGRKDDRTAAADGEYSIELTLRFANLDGITVNAGVLVLDTIAPKATVAVDPLLFSPNGDGRKDDVRFTQSSITGDDWVGTIRAFGSAPGSVPLMTWQWHGTAVSFAWNGQDEAGNVVKDGEYNYALSSADAAGNRAEYPVERIMVDNRPTQVFVTASRSGFSPNGDGKMDDIRFSPIVNLKEGVESWSLVLADTATGAFRKNFSGTSIASLPQSIAWDGKGDDGQILQGNYVAHFSVTYAKGNLAEAKSSAALLDIEGPKASVLARPELFSPDNDGVDDELSLAVSVSDASDIEAWRFEIMEASVEEGSGPSKERSFAVWSGTKKPAERILWGGKSNKGELVEAATDYPYYLTVRDTLGNTTKISGTINVDVLVIRDGDRLKIKVPSIVFRPNFADFKDLDKQKLVRNEVVLKRIAQILNRFRDYRIRVEGHANSIAKIYGYADDKVAKEENEELLPLSTNRADAVKKFLVQYGVDAKRLTERGLGSSEPVTDFKDAENRWKNRRVEFILIKE